MKTSSSIVMAALALATQAVCAQPTLILVRHAELEGQQMVSPPETPLSDEGRARAERLAQLLAPAAVARIYATDLARTQQTAEPLARAKSVPVTVFAKKDTERLVQALRQQDGDGVALVIGHSDTLPAILAAVGGPTDLKIGTREFGSIYVVTPRSGQAPAVMRLAY